MNAGQSPVRRLSKNRESMLFHRFQRLISVFFLLNRFTPILRLLPFVTSCCRRVPLFRVITDHVATKKFLSRS